MEVEAMSDEAKIKDGSNEAPTRDWYGVVTDAVVTRMVALDNGARASLRRAKLGAPPSEAFWRIAFDVLEPLGALPSAEALWRDEAERNWAALLGLIEPIAEQHRAFARTGAALADGLSEARVERLLTAKGDRLVDELRAVIARVRSDRAIVDARSFVALLASEGRSNGEAERRRFARDFYGAKRPNKS
jgi:hypothetical protein